MLARKVPCFHFHTHGVTLLIVPPYENHLLHAIRILGPGEKQQNTAMSCEKQLHMTRPYSRILIILPLSRVMAKQAIQAGLLTQALNCPIRLIMPQDTMASFR